MFSRCCGRWRGQPSVPTAKGKASLCVSIHSVHTSPLVTFQVTAGLLSARRPNHQLLLADGSWPRQTRYFTKYTATGGGGLPEGEGDLVLCSDHLQIQGRGWPTGEVGAACPLGRFSGKVKEIWRESGGGHQSVAACAGPPCLQGGEKPLSLSPSTYHSVH